MGRGGPVPDLLSRCGGGPLSRGALHVSYRPAAPAISALESNDSAGRGRSPGRHTATAAGERRDTLSRRPGGTVPAVPWQDGLLCVSWPCLSAAHGQNPGFYVFYNFLTMLYYDSTEYDEGKCCSAEETQAVQGSISTGRDIRFRPRYLCRMYNRD